MEARQERQFCPHEDFARAFPLIDRWPGMRSEIKSAIWELWQHCPPGGNRLRTCAVELGQWWARPGRPPRSAGVVSRTLARLAELGLVRYSLLGDGWIGIECVDPAGLDRAPLGSAMRCPPDLTVHTDPQQGLFPASPDTPRAFGVVTEEGESRPAGEDHGPDEAQTVSVHEAQAFALDGPEVETFALHDSAPPGPDHGEEDAEPQSPRVRSPDVLIRPSLKETSDVNVGSEEFLTDVVGTARRVIQKLWPERRTRLPDGDYFLVVASSILAHTTFDEAWLWESIEAVVRAKPKKPCGYLRGVFRNKCKELPEPIDFDRLLKTVRIPPKLARSGPSPEACPNGDTRQRE